ncbi:relaxase/mobilization nuclease domain-containing protein [Actinomadura logoneensis]|uniref:relaxase/mobilization nuclease domain-containing protein n=1 Tax=Actinomadura logoneensis TaxID=2293572 RepID=UPI0011C0E214|nr:hypothetical protein [Actinomadura logoneensis]
MIAKVLRRDRVHGVLRYLFGPGANVAPRIVAGFRPAHLLQPTQREDGRWDLRHLAELLSLPVEVLGDRNHPRPVWHVPVRAAPEDPILSDEQWAQVAREVMDRSGLAPDDDPDGVRWIAVRHADDHVHLVATLARQDGTRPKVWNDAYRVRSACRSIEETFGLRQTAAADRTAARRPTSDTRRDGEGTADRHATRCAIRTASARADCGGRGRE